MKAIELTLPEYAFLDGAQDRTLDGRNVILHVRSASVVEILPRENCILKEGTLYKNFTYTNILGGKEKLVAVLHYCPTLDMDLDAEKIKSDVLIPTAKWYCEYCNWEDGNVIENEDLSEYL